MNQLGGDFGPNHAAVVDLLVRYRALSPYRCLGEPTAVSESLVRVDFGFLVAHRDNRDEPWEGNLVRAEGVILQALRESERWPVEDNIQSAVFHPKPPLPPDPVLDDLLIHLDEVHGSVDGGYCAGTCLYPHEIFYDFNGRILVGAAMETALRDVLPETTLFRDLLRWLEEGHVPYGWRGQWPNGTLLLW